MNAEQQLREDIAYMIYHEFLEESVDAMEEGDPDVEKSRERAYRIADSVLSVVKMAGR